MKKYFCHKIATFQEVKKIIATPKNVAIFDMYQIKTGRGGHSKIARTSDITEFENSLSSNV